MFSWSIVSLITFKTIANTPKIAQGRHLPPSRCELRQIPVCSTLLIKSKPILHDSQQGEALMHGLATITDIVARYEIIMGTIHLRIIGTEGPEAFMKDLAKSAIEHDHIDCRPKQAASCTVDVRYCESLVKLYKAILEYQIKAALNLNKSTLSRFAKNLPKIDDW